MKKRVKRKIVIAKTGLKILLLFGMTAGFVTGARFVLLALFLTGGPQEQQAVSASPFVSQSTRRFIYDRNFKELAVSFKLNSVYAFPVQIAEPEYAADKLAEILDLESKAVFKLLKKKQNVVWIAQNVEPAVALKLRELDLHGIKIEPAEQRYYPKHFSAAHVVGFLNEEQGIAGIECFYDSVLHGGPVSTAATMPDMSIPQTITASNSGHLVLTLDMRIQQLLEEKLDGLLEETAAGTAKAVVMAVDTGEILALVNRPAFDPNRFWDFDESARSNGVVNESVHAYVVNRILQLAEKTATGVEKGKDLFKQMYAGSRWKQIQDGVYLSPEIAWKQASSESVRVYLQKDESASSTVDLPKSLRTGVKKTEEGDLSAMLSTMELAQTVSTLANGGKSVRPHLLSGFWNATVDELYSSSMEPEKQEIMRVESGGANNFFAGLPKQGNSDLVVMESLVNGALFKKTLAGPAGNAEQSPETEEAVADKEGFQSVLVGLTPAVKPEIVMVVVLDQARINPDRPSPVRTVGYAIADSILSWSRDISIIPKGDYQKTRIAGFYSEWKNGISAAEEKTEIITVAAAPAQEEFYEKTNIMPDLKGYSLRKALQELQQYGLDINIDGSGWVMDQMPAAGVVLEGKECDLKLSMVREELIRNIAVQ